MYYLLNYDIVGCSILSLRIVVKCMTLKSLLLSFKVLLKLGGDF